MRILRVRRGFTTNSSGANEFLPDGGRVAGASSTPPPASSSAQPVIGTVHSWGPPPEIAPSARESNARTVGVAAAVVAGALLTVPVVRFLTRKKKKPEDDPDAP
jgi:hypothetical protein